MPDVLIFLILLRTIPLNIYMSMLQLEFEKGWVLVACKGTLRREAPRRGWVWEGVTPSHWGGLGDLPQENFEK